MSLKTEVVNYNIAVIAMIDKRGIFGVILTKPPIQEKPEVALYIDLT